MDWIGCNLALIGSILLATNSRISAWGFVAFLISNAMWTIYAAMNGIASLLAMQLGFTATSILGIYRWRHDLKKQILNAGHLCSDGFAAFNRKS